MKYDVRLHCECRIEPHYCRELDSNFEECHGMNPNHGYTFEEAKEQIIWFLERKIEEWKNKREKSNEV